MRYFEVLSIQHFAMYLFPAIAFIALFIIGLGFYLGIGGVLAKGVDEGSAPAHGCS